jgi:nucleoside-triphosphatase THEP1
MPAEHISLASSDAGVLVSQGQSFDQLTFITGPSGAGKTTWCREAAIQAQAAGLPVAGLICPAIYEKERKVGIGVLDLKSGQRRVLATRHQPEQEGSCQWDFNLEAIDWANRWLQAVKPSDILFIDEFGPLELLRGQGFQEGVKRIEEGCFDQAFVVVRPSLLQLARERWPGAQILRLGGRLP